MALWLISSLPVQNNCAEGHDKSSKLNLTEPIADANKKAPDPRGPGAF
jgi:hypothetical protein